MKLPTTPVPYRWTAQDQSNATKRPPTPAPQTASGRDDDYMERKVTPYGYLPEGLPGCEQAKVGDILAVDLTRTSQFPYHTWRYSEARWKVLPEDVEWDTVPEAAAGAATLGDLCRKLYELGAGGLKKYQGIYDAFRDTADAGGAARRELARAIFDFWDNTNYRYAVTLRGFDPKKAFHEPWHLPTRADGPTFDGTAGTRSHAVLKVPGHATPRIRVSGGPTNASKVNTIVEPPKGEPPKMQVGFNYTWAWNQYGTYLGTPGWKEKWLDYLPRNLQLLKASGFSHVRVFLLCNGWNYGRVVETPVVDELPRPPLSAGRSSTQRMFEPPERPSDLYFSQFKRMLEIFGNLGLKVIPSFIDFHFALSTPRYQALTDGRKRAKLLAVLDGFLSVSTPDVVYAWEVMNEPSWATSGLMAPRNGGQLVPAAEMSAFLAEACARIEARGFASTVGHRFYSDLATFPTGTKRQFHYYAKCKAIPGPLSPALGTMSPPDAPFAIGFDPVKVPPCAESRAFIGEFHGSRDHTWPWWELKGRDKGSVKIALLERLKHLARLGYELALLWPDISYGDIDPTLPYEGSDDDGTARRSMEPGEFEKNPYSTMSVSLETLRAVEEFTAGRYRNGVPDPVE